MYYEHNDKADIAATLEFNTLLSDKKVNLDEYIEAQTPTSSDTNSTPLDEGEANPGEQGESTKTIYYITGKSHSEVLASPYIAQFRENNVDVLLLTDAIDEWIIGALDEYKEVKLKSVTANDISLKEKTEEEKKKEETTEKQFKDMLELAKNTI